MAEKPTMIDNGPLPETIRDVEHLEDLLTTPTRALIEDFDQLDGDLMVLGAGGKVGPTLAMMAKRAAPYRRVIGVARFTDPDVRRRLEAADVECLSRDLLDRRQVDELPDAENVVFMAGRKFGTAGSEPFTWAMNAVLPTLVAQRLRDCRVVVFSTLCVYPLTDFRGPGCNEDTPPTPHGEYANSCVARERIFQYYSERNRCPGWLIRLNYAIDLRYGVIHDLAVKVMRGQPIDIRTPVANVIWQGDAVAQILRSLLCCPHPSQPLNIGMPVPADIEALADRFGGHFGKRPKIFGVKQPTAWHNDTSLARRLFGDPVVDLTTMVRWNLDWIDRGMPVYDKPTHYEQREGIF